MHKFALALLMLALVLSACGEPTEETMLQKCGLYREDWKSAVMKGDYSRADAIMEAYKQDGCERYER